MQIVPFGQLLPSLDEAEEEGGRLGSGGFGVVYELEWLGEQIAVKKLSMTQKNAIAGDFIREVIVLGTVAHPNIVPLVGVSCDDYNRCLMYELMSGGSLSDRIALSDNRGGQYADTQLVPFPWQDRIQVLLDSCLGLACLHECTLLHCDIKPENILLRENGRAAVADFGLSRSLRGAEYKGSHGFTPGYADPYWTKERKYTPASDIFAMGVVIQQTLTGRGAKRLQDIRQDAMRQHMNHMERQSLPGLQRKRETEVGNDFAEAEAARKRRDLQVAQSRMITNHYLQKSAFWPPEVAKRLADLSLRCTTYKPEERPSIHQVLDSLSEVCNSPNACDVWPELDEVMRVAMLDAERTHRRHGAKMWGSQLRESLEDFQRAKAIMIKKREKIDQKAAAAEEKRAKRDQQRALMSESEKDNNDTVELETNSTITTRTSKLDVASGFSVEAYAQMRKSASEKIKKMERSRVASSEGGSSLDGSRTPSHGSDFMKDDAAISIEYSLEAAEAEEAVISALEALSRVDGSAGEVLPEEDKQIVSIIHQDMQKDSAPPSEARAITSQLDAESDDEEGSQDHSTPMEQSARENRKRMILNGTSLTRMTGLNGTGLSRLTGMTDATDTTGATLSNEMSPSNDIRLRLGQLGHFRKKGSPAVTQSEEKKGSPAVTQSEESPAVTQSEEQQTKQAIRSSLGSHFKDGVKITEGQRIRAGDLAQMLRPTEPPLPVDAAVEDDAPVNLAVEDAPVSEEVVEDEKASELSSASAPRL